MNNPFALYHLNAERISEIDQLRIDRENEIAACSDSIVELRHNVLLYGTRGVGKTFLLRLIEKEIIAKDETIFPCFVNIASLHAYNFSNDVGAFPRAVLLQLCTELWGNVLGKSYLDLRDRLKETGQELHLRKKDEVTIQRVYEHLMTLGKTAQSAILNTVGFSAGLKGEKKEETSQQTQYSTILPFEFPEFAHELIRNVLLARGKKRLVVLCDEANQMPIFKQEEILERYLELFSSKQIQFVFVAGMVPWESKTFLPSCFETRFELKGFSERNDVVELITRAQSDLIFTKEAIDAVFEAYSGHPRDTIEACAISYYEARKADLKDVSVPVVLRAIRRIDEERRRHKEHMRNDQNEKSS